METLLIIAGMALVTFLTRFTLIAALGRELPSVVARWLRFVPLAVLAALVAPAGLAPAGRIELGLPVIALTAGAVAAWRTRNVFVTILAGMAVYWLVRMIL